MNIEEKWPNPSWCIELIVETSNDIEIEDVLKKVDFLHKNNVGYAWGYEKSPYTISLHANKPKFLSLQLFRQAISKMRRDESIVKITETKVVNLFHENIRRA